jgi:hypothetical protein
MVRHVKRTREPIVPRYMMPATGYRESQYTRPALQRFTPLTWFLIMLVLLALVGLVVVVTNQVVQGSERSQSLSDLLATATAQQPKSTSTALVVGSGTMVQGTAVAPIVAAVEKATQTLTSKHVVTAQPISVTAVPVTSVPTMQPLPSPTFDVNGAVWQSQLVKQPDGTLMAPDTVIQRARKDLTEYYTTLRDLPLDEYLSKRDDILNTYFTGAALVGLQKSVFNRTLYLMNRAGDISIEVRDFSSNGLAATAGIRAHGWVNDVYDIASKQLVTAGRLETDTFSVVRIVFDRASERWKFTIVKQVTEVTRP